MANIPSDRKYTKDHEWVLLDGESAKVGITDYAQHELGDIVFVELPEAGAKVEQGKAFGNIEAVKTVAEIFSPVSGTILEVNKKAQDEPALLNSDCYGEGWLVRIVPGQPSQIHTLLDAAAYQKLISE